uniref:RNase H type-1 domain-containing protein n=1 Tax=Cannabis sativa TaxID=3483 RepID=A0A803NPI6_CANSA
MEPIIMDEMKVALFDMHPDKAPGPDGMTPTFYQKFWSVVGSDVVAVPHFFNSNSIPQGLNDTNLVLIPKKKNPVGMGDLSPISRCNILYKVISKTLANRLKDILDHVIPPFQSAFIPRRIFKAKYYPNGSYVTASLGQNPSFVWHSLFEAQSLIKTGCRWCIVDGSSVSVLDQAWLPHSENPFITSDHPAFEGINVQQLMVTGSLPIRAKLLEKRVEVPIYCPFFQLAPETITHLLVDCAFAKQCWSLTTQEIKDVAGLHFADWFTSMLQAFPSTAMCNLAMTCWGIWRARNDLVWNNKEHVVAVVVSSTYAYFNQWKLANVHSQGNNSGVNGVIKEQWSVPNEDTIKINVDASVFTSPSFFGIGWIARDHSGTLLYVAAIRKQGRVESVCAEAMGLKEVLSWIKTQNFQKVVVESDCQTAINSLRSTSNMPSPLESAVDDETVSVG